MIYLTIKVLKISCCPSKYTGNLCLSFLLNTVKYSFGWSGKWSGTGEISKNKSWIRDRSLYSLPTPPPPGTVGVVLPIHFQSFRRDSWREPYVESTPVIFCVKYSIQHIWSFLHSNSDSALMLYSAFELWFSIDVIFCTRSQLSIDITFCVRFQLSIDITFCVRSQFSIDSFIPVLELYFSIDDTFQNYNFISA